MSEETPSETLAEVAEKPIETNHLAVKPSVEPQDMVSKKPNEPYSYRGGTAYVGLSQAIKLTGSNKATIFRYAKSGKLSYETDEGGHRIYQVVELERVFGKLNTVEPKEEVSKEVQSNHLEPQKPDAETALKMALLEQEVRHLKEQNQTLQQNADDLRRAMLMLTHKPEPTPQPEPQPAPEAEKPKGFFRRLIGG